MFRALAELGEASAQDLLELGVARSREGAPLSLSSVAVLLRRMMRKGYLERTTSGAPGRPGRFRVVQNREQVLRQHLLASFDQMLGPGSPADRRIVRECLAEWFSDKNLQKR